MEEKKVFNPYDAFAQDYDRWFDEHPGIYHSEIEALSRLIPSGRGVDIGAGSGRFSAPFNLTCSLDPSLNSLRIAQRRTRFRVAGVAEQLPFKNSTFDYALMVTVDCFLQNIEKAFFEVGRVLRDEGSFVVGFIDRDSAVGKAYTARKAKSRFFRDARLHSVDQICCFLNGAGFSCVRMFQTVYGLEDGDYDVREGSGQGGFVVIKAQKAVISDSITLKASDSPRKG
ncbi:MAG: class I SAM-dependent methyltransferase [Chitinispirillaceae bacterium]